MRAKRKRTQSFRICISENVDYMHFCICCFLETLLLALFYAKLTIYELWTVFNNFMTFFAKNVRLLGGHVGGGNRVWGFGHRSNKCLLGWFIPLSLTLMMQSGLEQSLIAELMNWLNADQLSVITNGEKFNIDSRLIECLMWEIICNGA